MLTLSRAYFRRAFNHDVRSSLPAAIQAIMQNGLLVRAFEDALVPQFLYPRAATQRPWSGNLGDTATFTRAGLLTPVTTALTVGNDPTAATYSIEQYSATMNQYGNAVDTNLLQSAMTLASKFVEDNQILAINAGQSLNRISRTKLYNAYTGGRTWATATSSSSTTLQVNSTQGFGTVLVNGVPTAVSAGNPLNVTVNGVANTVTGVTDATHLVLGSAISASVGWAVVAANAPVSYRPTGSTRYDLSGSNTATMALFRSAVARLRSMNVPTVAGNYVAHIDPTTEAQLFADSDFKQAYQGRGDSAVFAEMSLGVFQGIDWVRNNEAPTTTDGGSSANLTVHQPLVLGADALLAAPFANMGSLLSEVEGPHGSIQLIGPADGVQVAHIVRPPQDRLQQVVSSAWSYVGDFTVPSDATTGDAALYKRAVLIEHC
ncbi:MAG TPA: hypothetical protein VFH54_06120 [Mycobacteriales bacterium]|nr:hypothetical protein [Mycobacteriales bacterium]